MSNVTHEIKANKLVITVDISKAACDKAKPSQSGKTVLVGSTEGAVKIDSPPGWAISYSLNVMAKPTGG